MDFFDILLAKKLEDDRDPTIEGLSVTENGIYSEENKAYSPVIVEVPAPTLKTKTITENGTYNASDDNADGYSSVTVAVEGFKKKSIANTPTDIASFNDGTANPMPSLEIGIEPVQSGSGDPSPSNVRPISGWTGANVKRTGKNLINISDVVTTSAGYLFNGDISLPAGEYVFSITKADVAPTGGDISIAVVMDDGTSATVYNTMTEGNRRILYVRAINKIVAMRVYTVAGDYRDIQFELGSTATAYEPYQGSTLSIPFHDNSDNPITVYGGMLNVTSGELRATHANIASYNGETINEPWISSMDVYSAGATPTTGAQVVYPLATPQTYQLTPTQVSTLLGQNNIFADCGQILDGEYFVTL